MASDISDATTVAGRGDTLRLAIYRMSLPLSEPYRLPFADLASFETLFVRLVGGDRIGLGEVTPLPGYSDESIATATAALRRAAVALGDGIAAAQVVAALSADAPFAASGLACAMETWREGMTEAFESPIEKAVPLVALCPGKDSRTAAQAARRLTADGYRVLKLKVAGARATVADDVARVRAVAAVVPTDRRLRLDANQCLDQTRARQLVDGLVDLPITLLEQPFPPEQWQATADFVAASPIPVMLDESICDAEDIDRASAIGVRFVKLKLCKHAGVAA